jgi:hypothetical protein
MLPVYFPFTSVSPGLMKASSSFFKHMAVYQISAASIPDRMKAWQEDNRLDIRQPLQHREKEVAAILSEFRTWAQLHQGGDLSFFKTSKGNIPFFNESSVAQIRKEIKTGAAVETASMETDASDLYPGVFLQMAQDLDENNLEIAGDLESQAAKEHDLINALKGDEEVVPDDLGAAIASGDQEAYMISERMAAWARIMLGDERLPRLLITSNPVVMDELVERVMPDSQVIQSVLTVMRPMGDSGQISQCQDDLAAYIEDIAVSAWEDKNGRPSFNWDCEPASSGERLSLYVFPGISPRRLLESYLTRAGHKVSGREGDAENSVNTVVGVLAHLPK